MKKLTISIVIPNWNGAYLMRKHLPKVIAVSEGAEVIVADDASSDESLALLKEKFPSVRVVTNKKQKGFAGNVNTGVAVAKGDIVVLLNTDVEPEKGFLTPLLKHFSDPNLFAVGCLEKSYDRGGTVLRGRGEARWRKGLLVHSRGDIDKRDTAWVSGGSGAFRRAIWNELGGMDPLYNPFYWEDIDLSYRALKAGYRLIFEKKSVIGHYHEEGKIKSDFSPEDVKRIAYRNQFIFIWKNLSDPKEMVVHCLLTPVRLLRAFVTGDFLMLQGYILAVMRLLQILNVRYKSSHLWRKRDHEIFHT